MGLVELFESEGEIVHQQCKTTTKLKKELECYLLASFEILHYCYAQFKLKKFVFMINTYFSYIKVWKPVFPRVTAWIPFFLVFFVCVCFALFSSGDSVESAGQFITDL